MEIRFVTLLLLFAFGFVAHAADPAPVVDWVTPDMKLKVAQSLQVKAALKTVPEFSGLECEPAANYDVYIDPIDAHNATFIIHVGCRSLTPPPPHALIDVSGVVQLIGKNIILTQVQSKFFRIPCSRLGSRYHGKDPGCR